MLLDDQPGDEIKIPGGFHLFACVGELVRRLPSRAGLPVRDEAQRAGVGQALTVTVPRTL